MRLLVTGGSGYLGAGILKRAPTDWKVTATWLNHPVPRSQVAICRLDILDASAVQALFEDLHPQVVIHTAALMRGDAMHRTNADGTRHIARAAARTRSRLIHLSSDVIFDGEHAPYDESAPPQPISAYGRSKAAAERAVLDEHPRPVIVRTSLIYGFQPLDLHTRQTLRGEMPRLFTDEYRCPIFVDDLADALLELAPLDYAGVLNIAGPQRCSRYEFGIKLAQALGVEPRFKPALSESVETAGPTGPRRESRPRDCTLVVSRARSLLQTELRGLDQVLASLSPLQPIL